MSLKKLTRLKVFNSNKCILFHFIIFADINEKLYTNEFCEIKLIFSLKVYVHFISINSSRLLLWISTMKLLFQMSFQWKKKNYSKDTSINCEIYIKCRKPQVDQLLCNFIEHIRQVHIVNVVDASTGHNLQGPSTCGLTGQHLCHFKNKQVQTAAAAPAAVKEWGQQATDVKWARAQEVLYKSNTYTHWRT